MAKKGGKKRGGEVSEPAVGLSLEVGDGVTPLVYPSIIVGSLRHMLSRLARTRTLPPSISMLAALPEEGVTYLALALACVLASDTERTYCVVELNWWRPGMAKQLPGIKVDGLGAVFTANASLESVLIPTRHPNLTLLPAGELALERRPSIARSSRLQEIIATLGKQFDHVILDVPAISVTSDAIPLAFLGNTGCIVIRQGVTPIATVKRAVMDVDQLTMLGAILNQAKTSMPDSIQQILLSEQ